MFKQKGNKSGSYKRRRRIKTKKENAHLHNCVLNLLLIFFCFIQYNILKGLYNQRLLAWKY